MTRRYQPGDVVRHTHGDDLRGREGLVLRAGPHLRPPIALPFDLLLVAYGEELVETDPWCVELVRAADRQLGLPFAPA